MSVNLLINGCTGGYLRITWEGNIR